MFKYTQVSIKTLVTGFLTTPATSHNGNFRKEQYVRKKWMRTEIV